jgi:primosomal protein N' (replication factor Y)
LSYPPFSRIAMLTLKGRNEQKVQFAAEHLKRELEKITADLPGTTLLGPAPAPLLRAETFYRYQLMLRVLQMPELSRRLAKLMTDLVLPDDVTAAVDIDPVSLS